MVELNYSCIGQRIKSRRKELKLTQKELGLKVGLSEASVSKYEAGKVEEATTSKLNDFATALDVDIAWLLGIGEENNSVNELLAPIAAHFRGKQISEEKLKRIEKYIEFTLNEED